MEGAQLAGSDRAGQRLLVLGAGPAQIGLLRAARERDLFVIAVDGDPSAPGFAYADKRALVSTERDPDCCLVNHYRAPARMGLHRDADEKDFAWPVLSISLGDPGLFRMGGLARKDPTASIQLESGDVVVFGGPARLAYHGIDRIRFGASRLLPEGGRINLTCRVVD